MGFKIAIDGPAGAGKSTVAKKIAKKLGYIYVDTGAMYRAMGLYLIRNGIGPYDEAQITEKCKEADISIGYKNGEQVVYLNGENVNALIRTEQVGNMASACSMNPDVRAKLVELQQKLASNTNVVMDGRDIGTVVLPDAQVKVFLTASSRIRAERRCKQLSKDNVSYDIDKIEQDIIARDKQDMTREHSPLKQAEDAVLIDSSYMFIPEVVNTIIALIKDKK